MCHQHPVTSATAAAKKTGKDHISDKVIVGCFFLGHVREGLSLSEDVSELIV